MGLRSWRHANGVGTREESKPIANWSAQDCGEARRPANARLPRAELLARAGRCYQGISWLRDKPEEGWTRPWRMAFRPWTLRLIPDWILLDLKLNVIIGYRLYFICLITLFPCVYWYVNCNVNCYAVRHRHNYQVGTTMWYLHMTRSRVRVGHKLSVTGCLPLTLNLYVLIMIMHIIYTASACMVYYLCMVHDGIATVAVICIHGRRIGFPEFRKHAVNYLIHEKFPINEWKHESFIIMMPVSHFQGCLHIGVP